MKNESRLPERRHFLRRGLWLWAAVMLMLCAMAGSVSAKTLSASEKAKIKYAQYLYSHETEGTAGYVESFAVVTLDDNGVPDLIEQKGSDTYNATSVVFLNGSTYKGAVRTWRDMFGVYYVYPKTGVYAIYVYDSDGSTRSEFLYRRMYMRTGNGKDAYIAGSLKQTDGSLVYYKSEKENTAAIISKASYTKRINTYTGDVKAKRVVFYKNTKANRVKYLGDPGTIATITLDKTNLTMELNETAVLTPTIKNGSSNVITWKSNNPKAVRVINDEDGNGILTARAGGVATITATVNEATAKCKVTVNAPSIELSAARLSVYTGKTKKLTAIVTGPSQTVTWKSADEKIATVSSKGKVTGKKAGTVKITGTANGLTATCNVTVKSLASNVSGLTKMAAGKEYLTRMYSADDVMVFKRENGRLYANDKAILKTKDTSASDYALYIMDLNQSDSYREFLELYVNSSGTSVMKAYRYAKGKMSTVATASGKKGSKFATGFYWDKSMKPTVSGNGRIVLTQKITLADKEKITVKVPYRVSSGRFLPEEDKNMTCTGSSNKLKSKRSVYDSDLDEKLGSAKKGTSYKPLKFVLAADDGYVGVQYRDKSLKKKVWLRFQVKNAVLG